MNPPETIGEMTAIYIYTFAVAGMHCPACGMLIDETVEDLPGGTGSRTSLRAGRTTVHADPTLARPGANIAAIGAAGYAATWEQP